VVHHKKNAKWIQGGWRGNIISGGTDRGVAPEEKKKRTSRRKKKGVSQVRKQGLNCRKGASRKGGVVKEKVGVLEAGKHVLV